VDEGGAEDGGDNETADGGEERGEQDSEAEGQDANNGAVVAAIAVVILLVVAVVILLMWQRKKKNPADASVPGPSDGPVTGGIDTGTGPPAYGVETMPPTVTSPIIGVSTLPYQGSHDITYPHGDPATTMESEPTPIVPEGGGGNGMTSQTIEDAGP
jgi:hypothetical protein